MSPELKEDLDHFTDVARTHIERDGSLCPVAFLFCPDGGLQIVQCQFQSDESKQATFDFLRKMAKEKEAVAVAVLCEAWVSKQVIEPGVTPEWNGVMPSDAPDKGEVIMVHVEEPDGYWLGMADITRDEKDKPTFGPVHYEPMGERNPRERLQNILP